MDGHAIEEYEPPYSISEVCISHCILLYHRIYIYIYFLSKLLYISAKTGFERTTGSQRAIKSIYRWDFIKYC